MDEINTKIINDLKNNSRKPFSEIARELGLTEGSVRHRVNSLVKKGTLAKFTIDLDKTNKAILCIEINKDANLSTIIGELKRLGFEEIYKSIGRYDLICFATATSPEKLRYITDQTRLVTGIGQIEAHLLVQSL